MRLAAHGIALTLPAGWSGRIFARSGESATLHAADYPLALADGEFGDASTARMPDTGIFMSLTEYRPGQGLQAGAGLFASRTIPRPLDPAAFSARGLAHHRPGQAGLQHFCTLAERPLCLYVVLAGPRGERARRLRRLDAVLATLTVVRRN